MGRRGKVSATLVHPSAIIGNGVDIGVGTAVMPGAVLVKDASVHGAYYGVPAKMSGHKGYFIG